MLYIARWKLFLILLISIGGVFFALPNLLSREILKVLPSWFPHQQLVLGLDLQGGSHLLLEVETAKLMEERYSFLIDPLRGALRKARIGYLNLSAQESGLSFRLREIQDLQKFSALLPQVDHDLSFDEKEGKIFIHYSLEARKEIIHRAVEKSIETIRQRIDETGTKEPLIQPQGEGRILLQLPGIDNPERVKQLIGKTAKLSFQLVEGVIPAGQEKTVALPSATELFPEAVSEGKSPSVYYLVHKEVLVTGDMLVDAQPTFDEYQRPQVAFRFNGPGTHRFGQATIENVGRPFAIVLDRHVISAPSIREPILTGSGVIQGNFTLQEAQDLSLLMRSGALPAPLKFLEERTVGPGLGADSIYAGTLATLIAIGVVTSFMILAYSAFGVFANIALFFNLALLLASLSLLGATLTLPGIAGIALAIGMAVDANVLINERIKEELRAGHRLITAIDVGYKRAMSTIIDSNLTTLIGAAILYYFGTGSVRGCAVTLALGILISMFTAISLSRVFVALWIQWVRPKTLWI